MAELKLYGCTVNYLKNPCGIDENPRFSYKISATGRGGRQLSRRIRVTDVMTGQILWDSGEVESENQILIPYEGESLSPLTKYEYQIDIKTDSGEAASGKGTFVTGKLGEKWSGKWISADFKRTREEFLGAQYLRKEFTLSGTVRSAYLAICGLGYFEAYLNGKKTGDDMLSPAFTRYDAECMYMVYDVLPLVKSGKNTVGVILGNGW